MIKIKILTASIFVLLFFCNGQLIGQASDSKQSKWVDSVYKSLSLQEKIAQLMLIRVSSYWNEKDLVKVGGMIRDNNIGGIVLFKGNPSRQAYIINKLQSKARTPMFVAIDGETGLSMRMDSTIKFPRQMMLGAIKNDSLIYEFGRYLGVEAKRMGIHISFSPVSDINNNALNPVIGNRSFGESPQNVTHKSLMMINGMMYENIIGVVKHFPGHGDTETDSHHDLPIIKKSYTQLNSTELVPFRELAKHNVSGIMTAHLHIPSIDSAANRASSLSPLVVNGILKDSLGYNGLIFTDGLDMRGVSKFFKAGEIELKALEAGNDILLLPQNPVTSIKTIIAAIDSGILDSNIINNACKKVLNAKYTVGLNKFHYIDDQNIISDLNSLKGNYLNVRLVNSAITCIKNENNFIPLLNSSDKLLCISIGNSDRIAFQDAIDLHLNCEHINVPKYFSQDIFIEVLNKVKLYDIILININNTNSFANYNYGITNNAIVLCDSIANIKPSILSLFATPYILKVFKNLDKFKTILISYQDNPLIQEATAQTILGNNKSNGVLPVSINNNYPYGTSISTNEGDRVGDAFPEYFNISSDKFANIDSLIVNAIEDELFTSASIGVIYKNKMIYNKNFGTPDINDSVKTNNKHLYDISALTKIFSTTLAIMKLYEDEKIDLFDPISKYLPIFENSNKENIVIKDLLLHQSGLADWLPFHKYFMDKDKTLNDTLFSSNYSIETPIKVAENIYCSPQVKQIILEKIKESSLSTKKYLRYSNLGFYLLKEIVEKVSNMPIDSFVNENIYKPLALKNTCFNPLEKGFSKNNIIPTTDDKLFRKQIIRGYVHDEGAALFGGVAGQAGLFSNVFDIAVLTQMLLQNGEYAGVKIFKQETIELFNTKTYQDRKNRRGLGFDKAAENKSFNAPYIPDAASPKSFGHNGYTGTLFWADPDYNLTIIFLSNRTYPSLSKKFDKSNIYRNLTKYIYEAIQTKN